MASSRVRKRLRYTRSCFNCESTFSADALSAHVRTPTDATYRRAPVRRCGCYVSQYRLTDYCPDSHEQLQSAHELYLYHGLRCRTAFHNWQQFTRLYLNERRDRFSGLEHKVGRITVQVSAQDLVSHRAVSREECDLSGSAVRNAAFFGLGLRSSLGTDVRSTSSGVPRSKNHTETTMLCQPFSKKMYNTSVLSWVTAARDAKTERWTCLPSCSTRSGISTDHHVLL